jgi:hypothetical protein
LAALLALYFPLSKMWQEQGVGSFPAYYVCTGNFVALALLGLCPREKGADVADAAA